MTTQPSDWAVARAYWEVVMNGTGGLQGPYLIGRIELRARELDASGGGQTTIDLRRFRPAVEEWREGVEWLTWANCGESAIEAQRQVDEADALLAIIDTTPRAAEAATTNSSQISSSLVVGDWLPIESAPKDGTHLWLFSPDDHPVSGYWLVTSGDDFHWEGWMFSDEILSEVKPDGLTPTHWRPLPPAPQAAMGAVGAGGGE